MTKANDFVAALQSQRHRQPEGVDAYWKRQQTVWIEDLSQLRKSIKSWISPVIAANVATVKDTDVPTIEPDLGGYDAPGLELSLLTEPLQIVLVRPRGLRIVGVVETGGSRVLGATGRVDLECGVRREILLRFRKDDATTWCSFSGAEKRVLDEEIFFELLSRIADVP